MSENKLRIGHTGITWLSDDDYEDTIRTIAAEGFGGIELFGWTLPKMKAQGKLGLFEECNLPLWSAYFSHDIINPSERQAEFNKIKEQGSILLSQGGTHVAFGGNIVDRRKVKYMEHKDYIVDFVNECGKLMQDMGLTLCYHPHTGTPVETKEEIMDFFQRIDPKYVAMAPDIGQIQKGGADPMEIIKTFEPLVKHVHFKDFGGKLEFDSTANEVGEGETYFNFEEKGKEIDSTGYINYCILGDGVVDLKGILDYFAAKNFDGAIMVELDAGTNMPVTPKEAVHGNKLYLQKIGYMK